MSFEAPQPIRQSAFPVDDLFIQRWSSRAFTGEPIPERDLYTCFEAARWAPSSFNAQPWRFVYAHRDSADWDGLFVLLTEKNQVWVQKASALVFIVSRTDFVFNAQTVSVGSHAFDAGAAWMSLALQAQILGYSTRAIGGFDRKAAPEALNLPDNYQALAAIAIGRRAAIDTLPEAIRVLEIPSPRRPSESFVFEGRLNPAL